MQCGAGERVGQGQLACVEQQAAGGVLAAGLLFALRAELPDTFVLEQGQPLAVESMPFLQAAPAVPAGSAAPAGVTAADKSANVTLTLLGLPVKTVRTVQQQRRTVQLGGTPFGVKMFTDGALVVAFSDIYTVHGSENPAKEAGLRLGDLILVEAGDTIPADAEVLEGVASVDESAITGESAPVIRESGGDFSSVTGLFFSFFSGANEGFSLLA